MTKIQIVTTAASISLMFDSFEEAEAAGFERAGPDKVGGSQLRPELRGQPMLKGLAGPMWGGWHDAEGRSIYFQGQGDRPDAEIAPYSPGKLPVAYHVIRYEDWGSYDLLSR